MFIVYTYTIQYLCLQCEFFFREIKVVKSLSITLMSIHQNGPMREKAKKMYKILEETPPRLIIYDMWHMDAKLSLKIIYLFSGLFVTILQFAYL
ncbi:uncharacterized protein LOC131841388 [Achroia grisella]|uniref:uncharacterized protein LOC131841388 n=1 Tax=Achroia grisella TaxID=688607 RepID=UPI0027D32EED|nr:uncharacterized protein LOC131841388 [Achroia grisella]